MTRPPPMTPPDSDLTGFDFMPLDVVRFARSDLVAFAPPEAVLAALLLWGASWHQRPAGSLTNDDRTLAQFAGYGRALKAWRKIKSHAMRGWVECSDGRLYHPVVAEKVNKAWLERLKQRHRTFCSAIRMNNSRNPEKTLESPSFENWLASGRPDSIKDGRKPPKQEELGLESYAQQEPPLRATEADVARLNRGKGREGKGEGESIRESLPAPKTEPRDLLALTQRITAAASVSVIQPSRLAREMDIVKRWTADGIGVDEVILPVIAKRLSDMADSETVNSLAYFDSAVRKAHNVKRPAKPQTAPDMKATDSDDARLPQIRNVLRKTVGQRTYDGWLRPGRTAMSLNGSSLKVEAASPFVADWIRQHFLDQIRETTEAVAGIDDVTVA